MVAGFVLFLSPTGYPQDPNLAEIKALEEMNAFWHNARTTQSEEASERYARLIHEVAALRDPRAVTALIGAIETGGMAINGLAALGDPALDPVIALTHDKRSTQVNAALLALKKMLKPENLERFKDQAMAKQKMKAVFEDLRNSRNRFISKNAREELDLLKDK
jgi:hypothetical protein